MLSIENIGHIDDILANGAMGRWFFRKLRNLRRYAVDAAKQIETALFSSEATLEVVEQANFSVLEECFRSCSPEIFRDTLPVMVENWMKWPGKAGYFGFKVIEELDPALAEGLSGTFLSEEESLSDIDKSSAVTQFIASAGRPGTAVLAEKYIQRVDEVANPFLKEIYERIAFSAALAGAPELGRKVFSSLVTTGIEKENLGNILGDIYMYGTEGHPFYTGLREQSLTEGALGVLAPLFAPQAPLEFAQKAVTMQGDRLYKEATLLLTSSRPPSGCRLWEVVDAQQEHWRKIIGQSRYKREFGLFLTALVLSCWLEPRPALGEIPTARLVEMVRLPMDLQSFGEMVQEEIRRRPEEEVVASIVEQFTRPPVGLEDRTALVTLAGNLGYDELVTPLLRVLSLSTGGGMAGVAAEALVAMGPRILPAVIETWERADIKQRIYLLDIMERLASEAFPSYLARSWEFMKEDHLKTWCQGALASGDETLLGFLEARMEEDPSVMSLGAIQRTYLDLSELLGVARPWKEKVEKARHSALSPREHRGPGMELSLVCPLCQEEAEYWVSTLIVTMGFHLDHPLVGGELRCSFCGGAPRFQISQHGFGRYIEEFGRISALISRNQEYESPIKIVQPFLVKGKALSIPQALTFFEEKVRENGESPKYHLYLGHIYQIISRYGQALEHFSQTMTIDATNIEAPYFMAMILYEMGRFAEAHSILGMLRLHLNGWSYYIFERQDRRKVGESISGLYNTLLRNLGIRDGQLEPDFLMHQKFGANDRCPCGSGKKFKKCCMKKNIY